MKKRYLLLVPILASCAQQQTSTIQQYIKGSMAGDLERVYNLSDKEYRTKHKLKELIQQRDAQLKEQQVDLSIYDLNRKLAILSDIKVESIKADAKDKNQAEAKVKLRTVDSQQFNATLDPETAAQLQTLMINTQSATGADRKAAFKAVNSLLKSSITKAYVKGTLPYNEQEISIPLIKDGFDWKVNISKATKE